MHKEIILSKSKYLAGLQCPKYLWTYVNRPEELPEPDMATQFVFENGHKVGNIAKELYPAGIEVEYDRGLEKALLKTKYWLGQRKTLFEPSIQYKNNFARADILKPAERNAWDIIEVKSSTSVKDINIDDLSFQKYCYRGAGLKIRKCYLLYINRDYVRKGDFDPRKFFVKSDLSEHVEERLVGIEKRIAEMMAYVKRLDANEVKIGMHCFKPYHCILKDRCWSGLPEGNVFELYQNKVLANDLFLSDTQHISEIPVTDNMNLKQQIQIESVKNNQPYVNKKTLKQFLNKIRYPAYFFDFETFAAAIPLFEGSRPYQNIPFQFSCHVLEDRDKSPSHFYFLSEGKADPRNELLLNLKNIFNNKNIGSVIVYYENFEKSILKELANYSLNDSGWILEMIDTIVDLYEPFRDFSYYHPVQKGSASLKSVLPAIAGMNYNEMQINNGQMASISYLKSTFLKDKELDAKNIEKIRKNLLDYCALDTEGMIFILKKLYEISED
jgi:hypothetical protein